MQQCLWRGSATWRRMKVNQQAARVDSGLQPMTAEQVFKPLRTTHKQHRVEDTNKRVAFSYETFLEQIVHTIQYYTSCGQRCINLRSWTLRHIPGMQGHNYYMGQPLYPTARQAGSKTLWDLQLNTDFIYYQAKLGFLQGILYIEWCRDSLFSCRVILVL